MILGAICAAACSFTVDGAGPGGARRGYAHGARPSGRVAVGDVLRGEFAIVSAGATGQSAARAEILEIAALRVGPGLVPVANFNVLVRPNRAVPREIAGRTGITQSQLECQGVPLHDAMRQLAAFVTRHPLFAHNAPFDQQLLGRAASGHGLRLDNPFYDSLMVAWSAWPGLPSYQLPFLAEVLGLEHQPGNGAYSSVKTTLALLRAASLPAGHA